MVGFIFYGAKLTFLISVLRIAHRDMDFNAKSFAYACAAYNGYGIIGKEDI